MKETTNVLLLTCNRKSLSKIAIDSLFERLTNDFFLNLIVVDNNSTDGTAEMLEEYERHGIISKLILLKEGETVNISSAYNLAYKEIDNDSKWVFCMQDDIKISKITPDISEQLISLMEKYPDHGTIGARIQRIPNLKTNEGNEELIPVGASISAYFRINRRSDLAKIGDNPFSTRDWDDRAMKVLMDELGLKSSWCREIWVDHMGHVENRGYPEGYKRSWGWDKIGIDPRKPYPKLDPETCKPLPGEKIYR